MIASVFLHQMVDIWVSSCLKSILNQDIYPSKVFLCDMLNDVQALTEYSWRCHWAFTYLGK
jgi:hypothetical protein